MIPILSKISNRPVMQSVVLLLAAIGAYMAFVYYVNSFREIGGPGYAGLTNLINVHEGNPELMEMARERLDYGGIRAAEWREIVDWHNDRRGAYQGPTIIIGEDPEDTYPKAVWKARFRDRLGMGE